MAAVPKCYLIVHNVSKKHNVGTLVRSAVAFNVHEVRNVRQTKRNTALHCIALGPAGIANLAV